MKAALKGREGFISFEYFIPRMGKRVDIVLIIGAAIFVLEFKVDEKEFSSAALEQVWDYALDLKNFHETSHKPLIAPVLIATKAPASECCFSGKLDRDHLLRPICSSATSLPDVIERVLSFAQNHPEVDPHQWQMGRYSPTPTIVEAAQALYSGHSVEAISRNDATAINLTSTSEAISDIIKDAEKRRLKRSAL